MSNDPLLQLSQSPSILSIFLICITNLGLNKIMVSQLIFAVTLVDISNNNCDEIFIF